MAESTRPGQQLNLSWQKRSLLALASGVTLALSLPNYNLTLLAWVSVGLLVLASFGAKPSVALLCGFLHAIVFYPLSLNWMAIVVEQYGNVPPLIAASLLLLISLAGGAIVAVFTWGIAFASHRNALVTWALAPDLWVAMEFARAHLPIIAFPWNLIGYAASGHLALVQLTTVTGIYGLSYLVAAYGTLLAYAYVSGGNRPWRIAIAVAAALVLVGFAGGYAVPQENPRFVAHLVQTNFEQSYTYKPDWMQVHAGDLDQLEQISVDAARKTPGLIVWPEAPAPFTLQERIFSDRARRIAQDAGTDFLVGAEDWKRDAAGKWVATNSAILLDATGDRIFTYDKIHLVPFGEYVPLRKYLTFAGKIVADIGDFTPGTQYVVGRLPIVATYVPSRGAPFGVFICFEAVFPDLVRHFTANGAGLLINISNDGWFGRSAAPAQHLMMARVRAVENRRWLLRDTNNGFTVSVDPYGRIVAALPTDIRGELDAPYDFRSDITLYTRFGDWWAWACVIASIALLSIALFGRRPT